MATITDEERDRLRTYVARSVGYSDQMIMLSTEQIREIDQIIDAGTDTFKHPIATVPALESDPNEDKYRTVFDAEGRMLYSLVPLDEGEAATDLTPPTNPQ